MSAYSIMQALELPKRALEVEDDRLSAVSSFYGPGATACWYLTVLSCFVYWSLHPQKRRSGSVDAGFIAVLTFPAVAAAHLIAQAHGCKIRDGREPVDSDENLLKLSAAIEASLNITETSLAVYVPLFLIAVGFRCVKRALLLAVVGLFAFSAEVYLYLACPFLRDSSDYLSRLFLTDYAKLIIAIAVILSVLVSITVGLAGMFIARRPKHVAPAAGSPEVPGVLLPQRDLFVDSVYSKLITVSTMLFLPASFVASVFPLSANAISVSHAAFFPWMRRLFQDLFPRTNVSIKELDQAVAVLAGAIVLGFSIYSAADAHFKIYSKNLEARREAQRRELIRMETLRRRVIRRVDERPV